MHSQDIHAQRILILDFGSQYTQLIARRVREAGVYCEIMTYELDDASIREFAPNGIILSGGPETVTEAGSPRAPELVFELGVPVLGICYGMQTMAVQFGGVVEASAKHEFGYARVSVQGQGQLLSGLSDYDDTAELDVWMSHGDKVVELPSEFVLMAQTESAPIAGMYHTSKPFFALQFHPEVTHTAQGQTMLERFVLDICQCDGLWTADKIIEDAIATVKQMVGDDEVILGLSGGVDSSVVAALLHRAIGDQLTCVFVDNGLLRLNEGDQVMEMFAKEKGIKVIRVNAQDTFLGRLAGVSDPEKKRKIIGNTFIDIFDEESSKLNNARWLAQGTIYPDVIESAASKNGKAHVIMSHHNVGGLPE
ncbi:MAG: glutamine-hydrolyzing GMP synthase, partial [Pseudomonadota bacterium]